MRTFSSRTAPPTQWSVVALLVLALVQPRGSLAWQSATFLQRSTRIGRCRQRACAPLPSSTDPHYYSTLEETASPFAENNNNNNASPQRRITLTRYLENVVKENPDLQDMVSLLSAVKMACKTISNLVNRAGLVYPSEGEEATERTRARTSNRAVDSNYADGRYYSMQRLDQLSTTVLKNALKYTGKCEVVAPSRQQDEQDAVAEHQPGVLIAKLIDSHYVACLDPLDGSGNADASICTGTVFGVFQEGDSDSSDADATGDDAKTTEQQLVESVLQPAKHMKAAGYCLYSSATVLVFTLEGDDNGVQGFTLDPSLQEFVLTHRNLTIPQRGTVYSCNEANSVGWQEDSFHRYLNALKTGTGESGQRYAHRYVGSMVGDIHRTLLYGGIFAYPADATAHPQGNLQLLYKIAPMAFVVHQAGGHGMDQQGTSLLELQPQRVHQKSPCFLGSPDDVNELRSYLLASDTEGLKP